ncbi:DUF6801 domain-containing protein [Kitasatospora sp. NPDC059571]|uniref:DUF6801 domain-containing protein n=1 Tax=Kitasatospora sp. NPDC059571 TaxID=3346871 RepID=UPI0036982CB3
MSAGYGPGSPKARTVLVIAAVGGAAIGVAGGLGTGTAAAQPARPTLRYTCTFPTIGGQPITARISTDIPTSLAVGESSPAFAINAAATVDATFTLGLRYVLGVRIMEGSLDAETDVAAPQGTIRVPVHLTITRTSVPAAGSFDIPATGTAPRLTFTEPGSARITAGDFTLHLVPEDANGNLTSLGRVTVPCTLNTGQSNVVSSFALTAAPTTTGPAAPGTGGTAGAGSPTAPATASPTTQGPTGSPTSTGSGPASAVPAGSAPPGPQGSTIDAAARTTATPAGRSTGGVPLLLAGVLATAAAAAAAAFLGPRWKRRRASGPR